MTPARKRLPARRQCLTERFEHEGFTYFATAGYFPDTGDMAELFLAVGKPAKPGTAVAVAALDGSVILSLALQYGCPLDTIKAALNRSETDYPAGPFGRALDALPRRVTFGPDGFIQLPEESAQDSA